jgi:hypothetical protein
MFFDACSRTDQNGGRNPIREPEIEEMKMISGLTEGVCRFPESRRVHAFRELHLKVVLSAVKNKGDLYVAPGIARLDTAREMPNWNGVGMALS